MDFFLAMLPILLSIIGMIFFYRSGAFVSVVGWILALILAVYYFHTPWEVALGASLIGIIKALGITLAITFTMFLIFLMKETGALSKIIEYIKEIAKDKEEQTLFLGMGFGSLSTSLGMVTPAMFPPIFRMLGFSSISAIAISILCYDPLTSFALFSIPITVPAEVAFKVFHIQPTGIENLQEFIWDFTFKITTFLPPISVSFAFIMLWVVGGKEAIVKHWKPALGSGLVLSLSALTIAWLRILPVEVIGIFSGFITMLFVNIYYRSKNNHINKVKINKEIFKAFLPFFLLILFSTAVNIPGVKNFLSNILSSYEIIRVFADKKEDLNIMANVWFWILVVSLISIFILKPSSDTMKRVLKIWSTRIGGPFIAHSLFFAVAFIMAWSGMEVIDGKLVPGPYFKEYNMNIIIAFTLANLFGQRPNPLVVPFIGLIGAFVGGSETASNVLFAKIQWETTLFTLGAPAFMWIFAAHAVGGGIASAITPSKITNAAATIGVSGKEEGKFIKIVLIPVLIITFITGFILMLYLKIFG
uniref:L-lactate permease n=1 Tax=Thermodesulfobacterium geofontis TaxID=1295609 RepID=A0A7C4JRS8_9BACT